MLFMQMCVCLSWTSFAVWRGNFGWRCIDVRCDECVRHRLGEHCWECWTFPLFLFPTWLDSTCGPANLNPFQPNSFEPSLVLLVVWHHTAMVPCWELYLMAFSGALNELRNYKKLPEVCLTFRHTACSLPDTTESTVIAWPEACML